MYEATQKRLFAKEFLASRLDSAKTQAVAIQFQINHFLFALVLVPGTETCPFRPS